MPNPVFTQSPILSRCQESKTGKASAIVDAVRTPGILMTSQLPFLQQARVGLESDDQTTDKTPALVDEATSTPELAEELAGESSDPHARYQTISQEVRDMVKIVDDISAAAVEVVEELTDEEAFDRHRLELKVERAFVEAGKALAELRNRKLYRSTHHSFEEYCQDRFGYTRYSAYLKIAASEVFDNLLTFSQQNSATESDQILPTKETQVRPLTKLEPEEQIEVWQQAVARAGGRVPTERLVKVEVLRHLGIVERLKEKHHVSATESYKIGDVFKLTALSGPERKYNDFWAIAIAVNDFTVVVDVHDGTLTVKPDNLKPIDEPDTRRQLPTILKRIKRLRDCGLLDRCAYTVLDSLGRQTYLSEVEEKVLCCLEAYYGVSNAEN